MDRPKSTRSAARKGLRSLSSAPRPSAESSLNELFPFGVGSPELVGRKGYRGAYDDRSIVLIVGTVLDQALEAALLEKLPGLSPGKEGPIFFDDGAPLATFDAKIRMAFALGIIGQEVMDDLSIVRQVRNAFAHSRYRISFDTPEVVEACAHISLPARKPTFVDPAANARETFIQTGSTYTINLTPVSRAKGAVSASIRDLPYEARQPFDERLKP